ncbi:nuclear transport factor 2 family protein [Niveibacterium sp. SC-1]|uniref:nuclear transport factor 2 family protein n=1 Tax=Niveibacterium sp. SC-1 TaxID=3135646 RepID=UPI00312021D1
MDPHKHGSTEEVLHRFNRAFLEHDPAALAPLIAPDCVVERSQPSPQQTHLHGREACLAMWQAIAANREGAFELEEVIALGELGLIFWTYRTGTDGADVSRGLNVMRVREGLIVEGRGYLKGRSAS